MTDEPSPAPELQFSTDINLSEASATAASGTSTGRPIQKTTGTCLAPALSTPSSTPLSLSSCASGLSRSRGRRSGARAKSARAHALWTAFTRACLSTGCNTISPNPFAPTAKPLDASDSTLHGSNDLSNPSRSSSAPGSPSRTCSDPGIPSIAPESSPSGSPLSSRVTPCGERWRRTGRQSSSSAQES
eukprot:scaffold259850_cov36-Tisochrysis_lutea.AAC.1